MSRTKNTAINQMSPDNDPSENLKLAQVGEMWNEPGFFGAFYWRLQLALCKYGESEAGRKESKSKHEKQKRYTRGKRLKKTPMSSLASYKAEIQKEIGEEVDRKSVV